MSLQHSRPFTNYTNIVFAPHTYTGSFTLDTRVTPLAAVGYAESLNTAWREATAMRAGVLVTEARGGRDG